MNTKLLHVGCLSLYYYGYRYDDYDLDHLLVVGKDGYVRHICKCKEVLRMNFIKVYVYICEV